MKKIQQKRTGMPERTTSENLELGFTAGSGVVLNFGNRVLTAWYRYDGKDANGYKAAVYEYTTDDHTCEGEIELLAESEEYFADNGHAIAWAMSK